MGKEKIILTDDRPNGRLPIGHYVGWVMRRDKVQDEVAYCKMFIFIAESQGLKDKIVNAKTVCKKRT